MFKIGFLLLRSITSRSLRHMYWMNRLSKAKLGKNLNIDFPVVVEGKGVFIAGESLYLKRRSHIGVGANGNLSLGNSCVLESGAVVLISEKKSFTTGNRFTLGNHSRLYVQNDWLFGNDVNIATNCSIFSREQGLYGKLIIGEGCNIGDNTLLDVCDDIVIGARVAIGPNCTFYTHDHDYSDINLPAWKGGVSSNPISIEDGAWIGSNVTILPGISIGKRAVIAAGSVVTKNVEASTVVGGVPAKMIKKI